MLHRPVYFLAKRLRDQQSWKLCVTKDAGKTDPMMDGYDYSKLYSDTLLETIKSNNRNVHKV